MRNVDGQSERQSVGARIRLGTMPQRADKLDVLQKHHTYFRPTAVMLSRLGKSHEPVNPAFFLLFLVLRCRRSNADGRWRSIGSDLLSFNYTGAGRDHLTGRDVYERNDGCVFERHDG
jgi:hypothetical protein